MTDLRQRAARPDDHAAIVALAAEHWRAAAVLPVLESAPPRVWVAEVASQVAGLVITEQAADVAEVQLIVVGSIHRRTGVGSALLQGAIDRAVAAGATALFLEVADGNAAAVALYRSAGFSPVARRPRYYANGADALVMRLDLPAG